MSHFPFFMEVENKTALIIGGGEIAREKAEKLSQFGVHLRVLAPEILPELAALADTELRPFRPEDLDPPPAFVVAATNDRAVNRQVAGLCRAKNIPVNVADDPEACDFFFPALVKKGSLTVAIGTDGASPAAAKFYRQQIEAMLPDTTAELLDYLRKTRETLQETVPDPKQRSTLLRRIASASLHKGAPLTQLEEASETAPVGTVYLVGAGCGSADLITVRGMRLLQTCDAVVYDELIAAELLDWVPPTAQRIAMGKRSGKPSASQPEIIAELIRQAGLGRRVVRLKGGDPYLFGRGGEELFALRAAGIPCEEVPGIPSAIGIPAQYDIPVTHRGVSRSLHIITAHTREDELPADLPLYAKLEGTLVFLMGLSRLKAICAALIRFGKPADTPAAVLSGGNAPNPVCIRGTLETLPELAKDAAAPAIIVVGGVTRSELPNL